MSDEEEPEWKGRVAQIDDLAKEDPGLAQRLRAARSKEFLEAHDAKAREAETDFARSMMHREKEDLLRINARVRQVNQWCRLLGEMDRKYTLVKFPSDLLSPYGQYMAQNDARVAQKAQQLKPHLALPSGPTEPRARKTRAEVYEASMTAMRSPPRAGAAASSSASLPAMSPAASGSGALSARAASPSARRPGSAAPTGASPLPLARPATASLARASVPAVTTSRVVIRLSRSGEEPRQLSVPLFEREYAKIAKRVELAKKAAASGAAAAPAPAAMRGAKSADRLLVAEASAVVDNRASAIGRTAATAAARRQTKAQVQSELRRALRETAFLTQALRTQARILKERGWNQGGRSGAPAPAPDGVAALARARARGDA